MQRLHVCQHHSKSRLWAPANYQVNPRHYITRHGHKVYAGASRGVSIEAVLSLPLFPLPNCLHPAQAGTLLVYEAKYLSLFRGLQAATAAGSEPKFGHILAPGSAPPALMQDSIGGLPNTGVCATVKAIEELEGGRLKVTYQGSRRFKLLAVDHDSKPYPKAAATWVDDDTIGLTEQQIELTDQLEQDVYSLLQQVVRYSQILAADSSSKHTVAQLPNSVLLYAPPPPAKQKSSADYLVEAGRPATAFTTPSAALIAVLTTAACA
eukprot:GHRR01014952.1.p1 GENE.GHRR01014952.1~~GHRR01014952.1.p1  ORF type:complete len:265 (+),score=80.94 GHRR01014952.1:352-1146(+)